MTTVTVVVPLTIRGGRKAIIAPDCAGLGQGEANAGSMPTGGEPALVKAIARAHRWRGLLENGTYATVRDMAKIEKVDETYVCRVLRLTLLAPDLVETILVGNVEITPKLGLLLAGVPDDWEQQRLHNFT
jgi:hypothetical protein